MDLCEGNMSGSIPQDESNKVDPELGDEFVVSQQPHVLAPASSAINEATDPSSSSSRNREQEIPGGNQTMNRAGMQHPEANRIVSSGSNQIPMQWPHLPPPPSWMPHNTYQQPPMSIPYYSVFQPPVMNNYRHRYPIIRPASAPVQMSIITNEVPYRTPPVYQDPSQLLPFYNPHYNLFQKPFGQPNPNAVMYYPHYLTMGPVTAPNQMSIITNEVPYQHPMANQMMMPPGGEAGSFVVDQNYFNRLQQQPPYGMINQEPPPDVLWHEVRQQMQNLQLQTQQPTQSNAGSSSHQGQDQQQPRQQSTQSIAGPSSHQGQDQQQPTQSNAGPSSHQGQNQQQPR